ncbi:acetyltransferase [Nannizzia gypsea CBS 118893]|uniref:Acetyltransferase n=1 Tax=Arthroderma gypseum (strain ATCC MYA-4604 / CBS 118893) TaxID=535722 RepID=E5R1H9_ARTGP|nr:acetyltransferase [Nannizzia gypsea CBS 118893]EFQ98515.1 acetyltransferase [Nannizzia gypsea CBS 118893]
MDFDLLYDRPGGEPYLTIPGHPNIIITPPRVEDASDLAGILNIFEVAIWLQGPPYPYPVDMARQYLETVSIPNSLQIIKEIEAHKNSANGNGIGNGNGTTNLFLSGCPVNSIREIDPETGKESLIGCIGIRRDEFYEIEDDAVRETRFKANVAMTVGDASIVWAMGNFLSPSHQGRGITTIAAKTVIDWGKKHMNIKEVRASMFDGNIASRRVYEKIGFKYITTRKDALTRVDAKGGGKITLHFLSMKEQ